MSEIKTIVVTEGTYVGHLIDGVQNGKGEFKFNNGDVYNGDWKNGQYHGFGVFRSDEQMYNYRGYWKHGLFDGFGTYTSLTSKHKSVGEWKKGVLHGIAETLMANEDKFRGRYEDGMMKAGILMTKDGEIYVGEFLNDKYHGTGTIHEISGNKYAGMFKQGQREGKGLGEQTDGDRYDGDWHQGVPDGFGKWTSCSPDGPCYTGDWAMGSMEGKCILLWDGDEYRGEMKANQRVGEGSFKSKTGYTYSGGWKKDVFDGTGTLKYKNGNIYHGQFHQGVRQGYGQLNQAGAIYEGNWHNNSWNGPGMYINSKGDTWWGAWKEGKIHGACLCYKSASGTFIHEQRNNGEIVTRVLATDVDVASLQKLTIGKGDYLF